MAGVGAASPAEGIRGRPAGLGPARWRFRAGAVVPADCICRGLADRPTLVVPFSKWRMTPVLREGPEGPGALEWEAAAVSAVASAAASGAGAGAVVGAGAEAAELAGARPRTRR